MVNATHKRRLRDGNETGRGSDGNSKSEWDRFRFREVSSSLSSEPVEWVREGVADGLRDGGDGNGKVSGVPGDCGA